MEKRVLLAALLTVAFLFAWQWYFARNAKPTDANPESQKTEAAATAPTSTSGPSLSIAPATTSPVVVGPHVAPSTTAADATFELKNDSIHFTFAAKGAAVQNAVLEDYFAHPLKKGEDPAKAERLQFISPVADQPSPLQLFDEFTPKLALEAATWSTNGVSADGKSIAFSIEVEDGPTRYRLTKSFRLLDRAHRLGVELTLEHLAGTEPVTRRYWFNTSGGCSMGEHTNQSSFHALVGFYDAGEVRLEPKNPGDVLKQDEKRFDFTTNDIRFGCDMGVYFGVYLYCTTKSGLDRARVKANAAFETTPASAYTQLGFLMITQAPGEKKSLAFDYYIGPKDRRIIDETFETGSLRDAYASVANYELNQQGGMCCYSWPILSTAVETVSKVVLLAISFFGKHLGNMGVAIMLLTLCIRILLFPLNRKSQITMQRHSEKMAKIKPMLDKAKEKYKADPQKMMGENSRIMKEHGVSYFPVSGCLPAFLQMPVFFGLWSAIRFDIHLRQAAFLWCPDLSQPDNLLKLAKAFTLPWCSSVTITGLNILPILMTAAWFFDAKLSMVKTDDPQTQQQQKMMQWMPLMFGLFMYGAAAGLSLYYLTNSLLAMTEKRIVKKFFPIKKEDGAPAVIDVNAKK